MNLTHQLEPFEMLLAVSRILPKDHQLDFMVTGHVIVLRLIGPDGSDLAEQVHELDGNPWMAQELQRGLSCMLRKLVAPDAVVDHQYRLKSVLGGLQAWSEDEKLPRAFRQKARLMLMNLQGLPDLKEETHVTT